jgi:pyruvate/2-oxoglutarate dehydrogenase complex dihydrolipoamide dehydrogenase (E3) component
MQVSESFDLVVLGSGSAAQSVASRCRKAGWTVAMIDKRPFGGTCALRGCDPKKVLVGAAAAVDGARLLAGKGIRPDNLTIDWQDLIQFKRTFTEPYSERLDAKLSRDGIEAIRGAARFVDPTHIEVGGSVLLARRAIVIATGARPSDLPFDGREHAITSDQFLDLTSLPASIAFIGGGYISFEFAHVAARAGASVTILHRDNRPLAEFDAALVKRLVARTEALGIEVRLNTDVKGAANLLEGNHATPTYDTVPGVVFTTPPLARVGLTEDEARAKGVSFSLHEEDTSIWYSSRRVGETHSGFKVLVESATGRILGAHLLGPHAEETINLFTLAIRAGVTADRLTNTLWAYPTVGADSSYMV